MYETCANLWPPIVQSQISNGASGSGYTVEVNNACFRAEACVDLQAGALAEAKSLRAYIDVNPCEYEFHIGFEDKYFTEHIAFTFPYAKAYWYKIGPYITVK